jgi:hypothetical protein
MNTNNEKIVAESDEISLKDLIIKIKELWTYLLKRWRIILFAGILGGMLGFTYAYFQKPVYRAELSFASEDEKSSGGGLGGALGLASQFGIDLGGGGGGAFSGDNLLSLMKSRSMVESSLLSSIEINGKVQTLGEMYIDFNNFREAWANNPQLKNIQFLPNADRSKFTLQQDSVLGVFCKTIIRNNLTVDKVEKKLSIITVTVSSQNELFSKLFTEILVKTVSDFYINTKIGKSIQNVRILQKQTDSVRRELNLAINGVASSVDVNPNANPSLQILRAPSQRRQVDVQANQAILTQLVANLEISKVSLRKETPLIQVIDKPILPLEMERLGKGKGFVMGAFLFGFLIIIILGVSKVFKSIMN